MKNYKELRIWQQGMTIVKEVYLMAQNIPDQEKYGLRSQITRAAVSIPSNFAEGSSRDSDKDYKRFLEIALGSAFELETQLLILEDITILDKGKSASLLELVVGEQKMIHSFINKLRAIS